VLAYDLDRLALAPFKISNLWRERNPKARMISIVALALHPRDIGTLMIAYSEGVVLFSFKQNKPLNFLQYEPQTGIGASGPSLPSHGPPKLVHAVWHPNGTFILTGHDDSTFAIWDSKNGKLLLARSVEQGNTTGAGSTPGSFSPNSPLFRMAWCSKPNPDDTGILIAGGVPMNSFGRSLTFLNLGPTPVYATSSWQILTSHFENPKSQRTLPTPPNIEVVDFCIIPRKSPHYAGCHDPIAIVALLASGEITTLSFPSGHPITPTNQLHPSLTFVHPFVNHVSLTYVQRTRWLAMKEKRAQGPPLLVGGAEQTHPLKRYEDRNVIHTIHADGIVRIWDAGHGDEVENDTMLQVDVARALGRTENVDVVLTSMSGATSELAVGTRSGEVAIFRYDRNQNFGQEVPPHVQIQEFGLEDIKDRAEPSVKEGLLPLTLLSQSRGPVSALKVSDVGFVVAGFEDGSIVTIDLRGPAVIDERNVQDSAKVSGRGSIRRNMSITSHVKADWPTVVEFGVMSLEGEGMSIQHRFSCEGEELHRTTDQFARLF
jgi:syntaxin-binding protein 5